MKEFSLDEYLANPSRKVVTRDGKAVKILYTDARRDYSIIALVEREVGKDYLFSFLLDGTMYDNKKESVNDLFFSDEQSSKTRKEGYVNLYREKEYGGIVLGCFRETEEEANKEYYDESYQPITILKLEWEE